MKIKNWTKCCSFGVKIQTQQSVVVFARKVDVLGVLKAFPDAEIVEMRFIKSSDKLDRVALQDAFSSL